jgi:hypothetical protein
MKPQIKYIELKSGYSDNGPAWIGLVSFSKTGKTVYFNGQAFGKGHQMRGNYFDIETNEEYWISGVKKDMTDRHWAGGGMIYVEQRILADYLDIIEQTSLDKRKYEIIEVQTEVQTEYFHEIENEKNEIEEFDGSLHFKEPADLSVEQLRHVVAELEQSEISSRYNKGRRSHKALRLKFEAEIEKRIAE